MSRARPPGAARPRASSATRGVQARLVAAFLAVVAGLVAVGVAAAAALAPQMAELGRMGDEHATAVAVASQVRERLAEARRRVVLQVRVPAVDGAIAAARAEIRAAAEVASRLEPLADTAVERSAVVRLGEALVACEAALQRAGDDRARRADAARAALVELFEPMTRASAAADAIVSWNAAEVQRSAGRMRARLRWIVALQAVLTLLAAGAAALLLRHALDGVARHAQDLEQHSAEMAAFASRAAHELRTPLQTLQLALALSRRGGAVDAAARAERAAARLAETIDDMLELSRAGTASCAGAHTAVAPVVAEVAEELRPRARDAGVAVSCEVAPGLEVAMDARHLSAVLSNLVGNAVKYGARDGGRVWIASEARDERVQIRVADDGPGIPRDALPRIFDPFFRASDGPEGYGVGLSLVKRLVEAHGGHVRASSEAGAGASFVVELPRGGADARAGA